MKIKMYFFRKLLPFFIKDFRKYLDHIEYYYSDYFFCGCENNFDDLEDFLLYSDKYISEIKIVRSWVTDYEYFKNLKK